MAEKCSIEQIMDQILKTKLREGANETGSQEHFFMNISENNSTLTSHSSHFTHVYATQEQVKQLESMASMTSRSATQQNPEGCGALGMYLDELSDYNSTKSTSKPSTSGIVTRSSAAATHSSMAVKTASVKKVPMVVEAASTSRRRPSTSFSGTSSSLRLESENITKRTSRGTAQKRKGESNSEATNAKKTHPNQGEIDEKKELQKVKRREAAKRRRERKRQGESNSEETNAKKEHPNQQEIDEKRELQRAKWREAGKRSREKKRQEKAKQQLLSTEKV
ncbi:hypothetical protein Ocin01_15759 [Orchesella cincta]|uniref:Uncharacterized protein n=1 Tax=Orchesella cincta TaxID=48709 RepID=A0A1D2MD69_ORCCI|nr:hypothetical protein Ocin01_15759 [Orchesella cincta]